MRKIAIIAIAALSAGFVATGWMQMPMPEPIPEGASAPAETAIGALAARQAPDSATPSPVSAATPLVLELFTSQGCSSCPPADALMEELARTRADVLVISRPVTYWDRLGWRDTLALPENTDLQRAYAARGLAGRNGVYTPQAVVDGRSGTVGSRAGDIDDLLRQAAPARRNAPQLTLADAATVTVRGAASGAGELSLVALDSRESVSIALGENRDRTVTYTNRLVEETRLGSWSGGDARYALPAGFRTTSGADRFALILRDGVTGPIIAARRL